MILDSMDPTAMTLHVAARSRAIASLTAWDSQGGHRTATSGDEAGAQWLSDEAARLGVEVT
jgi:hypothetical protein